MAGTGSAVSSRGPPIPANPLASTCTRRYPWAQMSASAELCGWATGVEPKVESGVAAADVAAAVDAAAESHVTAADAPTAGAAAFVASVA